MIDRYQRDGTNPTQYWPWNKKRHRLDRNRTSDYRFDSASVDCLVGATREEREKEDEEEGG